MYSVVGFMALVLRGLRGSWENEFLYPIGSFITDPRGRDIAKPARAGALGKSKNSQVATGTCARGPRPEPADRFNGATAVKPWNRDSIARKSGYSGEQFATAGRISW